MFLISVIKDFEDYYEYTEPFAAFEVKPQAEVNLQRLANLLKYRIYKAAINYETKGIYDGFLSDHVDDVKGYQLIEIAAYQKEYLETIYVNQYKLRTEVMERYLEK